MSYKSCMRAHTCNLIQKEKRKYFLFFLLETEIHGSQIGLKHFFLPIWGCFFLETVSHYILSWNSLYRASSRTARLQRNTVLGGKKKGKEKTGAGGMPQRLGAHTTIVDRSKPPGTPVPGIRCSLLKFCYRHQTTNQLRDGSATKCI